MRFGFLFVFLSLLFSANPANSDPGDVVTGGELIKVVNVGHPQANDDNPGTGQLPVATIGRALELIRGQIVDGQTARVVIHEGVYREYISWKDPDSLNCTLILQANEGDSVVISGADIWSGWERIRPGADLYRHDWPYQWGLISETEEWIQDPPPQYIQDWIFESSDLLQRREMIFVNNERMRQVLYIENLERGSFYVDEEQGIVTLYPPVGVDMDDATVEVSSREMTLWVLQSDDVRIYNLNFMHANPFVMGTSALFTSCYNVNIANCSFDNNNWAGVKIGDCTGVAFRRCTANNNGGLGFTGDKNKYLLMDNCESNNNNWRGYAAGTQIKAIAGSKFLHLHHATILGHTSTGNYTRGFWFDTDNSDILISGANLSNNTMDGIFFEASQGPITVQYSTISNNSFNGVLFNAVDSLSLIGNEVEGNGQSQLYIGGAGRWFDNWETGEGINAANRGHLLRSNTFTAEAEGQLLFDYFVAEEAYQFYLESTTFENNIWNEWGGAAGTAMGTEEDLAAEGLPAEYDIVSAFPNPFNPTTAIVLALPEAANLKVAVFNVLGQQVAVIADGRYPAGYHTLGFNATGLTSGVYFIRATVPGKMSRMEKVVLAR